MSDLPVTYYRHRGDDGAKATRIRGAGALELSPKSIRLTNCSRTSWSTAVIAGLLGLISGVLLSETSEALGQAAFTPACYRWFLVVRRVRDQGVDIALVPRDVSKVVIDRKRRAIALKLTLSIAGTRLKNQWLLVALCSSNG